jgi:phage-related protein
MAETEHNKQWRFYETDTGHKVVKEELEDLVPHGKAALVAAMKRYRLGESAPKEVSFVGRGITELRTRVGNDHFRVLFAPQGKYSHVLLAVRVFYKNSKKLPKTDHDLAISRLNDWKSNSLK